MRTAPTDRLAVLVSVSGVVAFLGVVLVGAPVIVAFGAAVLVVVVTAGYDGVRSRVHRDVTITRRHPPVVVLGSSSQIEWEIRSDNDRAIRVLVAEPFPASLGAVTRRFAVTVPAHSTVGVSTTIKPSRRGRYAFDHMTVRAVGPLGLMSSQRDVELPSVMRIHPRFRSAGEAELRIRRAHMLEVGTRRIVGLGGGTDFEQLREYEVDDEYRQIDWTATARAGRPVVRTYRAERNQHVMILLDSGRVQAGLVGGVPRVEYAMDAAMMLATISTRLGDHCGLVGFDRGVRTVVPPGRRRDQVSRISEAMFDMEPELAESDYAGAFSFAAERFGRRMMMVLLTDVVDHVVSEALMPALPTLMRKHVVVIAAARDPRLDQWAAGDGPDTGVGIDDADVGPGDRMSRRLAAIETLTTRRLAVARLRSTGAVVIDTLPERMASELGDAYLMVKGTGRL